ncbi:MAG: hypothetical protein ACE365_02235 [Gammaproteobacteria bacterium]
MILKKLISLIGALLFVLSILFVSHRIYVNFDELKGAGFSYNTLVVIFVFSFIYALSNFILSSNWRKLLLGFGQESPDRRVCFRIYAVSVLTKYIPGAIFQYASRQAMGKKYGFNQVSLIIASFFEFFGLVIAASFLTIVGTLFFRMLSRSSLILMVVVIVLLAIFLYALLMNMHKIKYIQKYVKMNFTFRDIKRHFFPVLLGYVLFFLVSGLLVFFLGDVISGQNIATMPLVISAWAFSWLMGYVVIWAVAGLGVREAFLIATLSGIVGEAHAILIALSFRMAVVLGDVIFYSINMLFLSGSKRVEVSDVSGQ